MLMNCMEVIVAQSDAKKAHDIVSALFKASQVAKISIIHVPGDLETRTRIDQRALRQLSRIELSFNKPGEEGILQPLQAALEELNTGKPSPVHEIRWGILLFDGSGKERAAVFLDQSGQFMQIGDTDLQVQGKTLAWLKKSAHDAFQ